MKKLSLGLTEQEILDFFRSFDADGSGGIDFIEVRSTPTAARLTVSSLSGGGGGGGRGGGVKWGCWFVAAAVVTSTDVSLSSLLVLGAAVSSLAQTTPRTSIFHAPPPPRIPNGPPPLPPCSAVLRMGWRNKRERRQRWRRRRRRRGKWQRRRAWRVSAFQRRQHQERQQAEDAGRAGTARYSASQVGAWGRACCCLFLSYVPPSFNVSFGLWGKALQP